ncbi:hypothetical protein ACTFIY_009559 [Dictyostelium cf. discoideum]
MNKLIILILSVLLIILSVNSNETKWDYSSSGSSDTTPGDFDYYLFVQQWIYSYCSESKCIENKEREAFTIHGLWPNDRNNSYPAFCTGPSFDLGEISDLEDQLNIDWISLTEDNDLFWTSEYKKHGTCAVVAGSPISNEHDYFVAGLKLYTQHNLTSALISENIYPSDQDTYEADSISSAINSQFGGQPVMQCDNNKLSTIALCIDKKTLSIMDCPEVDGFDTCSGKVSIPSSSNRL